MTPPNSPRFNLPITLAAQLIAGISGGIALGLLIGWIGGQTTPEPVGMDELARFLGGILLGYPLGVIGGIYLMSHFLRAEGSAALLALGTFFGLGLIMLLAEPLRLNQNTYFLLLLIALSPASWGLLGFYLPRLRRNASNP
jgi:hypothetical protein